MRDRSVDIERSERRHRGLSDRSDRSRSIELGVEGEASERSEIGDRSTRFEVAKQGAGASALGIGGSAV